MKLSALIACACAFSASARAENFDEFDARPVRDAEYHSPQHFALELKGGPYSPDIDSTPGLTGKPFSELFNSQLDKTLVGKRPPGHALIGLEFDWQFWHPFGSFALALSASVQHRTTHTFEYLPADKVTGFRGSCVVPNCIRSGDETGLTVFPLDLELVYRFDVLALRYKVPLVPYLKGGLGYYFWFVQKGDSGLAASLVTQDNPSEHKAIGGTLGLVAHPGLALMLDIFDPGAARTLDTELGINHTYLFFELNYAWITGLGFKDKMVFSDLTWNTGIAFEF